MGFPITDRVFFTCENWDDPELNDPLRSATMKAVALGTSEISKVHNSQATRSSSIAGDLYRKQGPVM